MLCAALSISRLRFLPPFFFLGFVLRSTVFALIISSALYVEWHSPAGHCLSNFARATENYVLQRCSGTNSIQEK